MREAVELGITHIDTADFYGPHVPNQIIREALSPYPDDPHIVTKVGSVRDAIWAHRACSVKVRRPSDALLLMALQLERSIETLHARSRPA